MEVEIFSLCDYAVDTFGKLTLVGTFDVINAPQLPFTYSPFYLAIRLRCAAEQQGKHALRIMLRQPGRENETMVTADINAVVPAGEEHSYLNIALNVGMTFQNPGRYALELFLDDEWRGAVPLTVKLQPQS